MGKFKELQNDFYKISANGLVTNKDSDLEQPSFIGMIDLIKSYIFEDSSRALALDEAGYFEKQEFNPNQFRFFESGAG